MESRSIIVLLALCAFVEISANPLRFLESPPPHHNQITASQTINVSDMTPVVSVQTTSGKLIGAKQTLSNVGNNSSVFKFLAVPYAEAPIGKLRFRRPVEIDQDRAFTERDASKFGRTCPQFRHLTKFISPLLNIDNEHQTSEDCLHLNVFVPSAVGTVDHAENNTLEPNKQLPVIVWIPGEGFDFADARQFDGSYLAHKTQSIVITVQYRVGVLGFLQAPQFGIKGNMGVYDQIEALRWIKRNVAAFGGDSERVTVMGRFSGSMSISAMITAPNQDLLKLDGRPLFNRVALLSGIAVDSWIIDSQQYQRVAKIEETALAGSQCTQTEISNGSCLQNLPIEQLLPLAGYGWRLVVDDEIIGKIEPIDAATSSQFASHLEGLLIGETGMEGTLCLYRHMLNSQTDYARLIEEDKLTRNDVYDIIQDDSDTYFNYNLSSKQNPILESLLTSAANVDGSDISLRDIYLNACSSFMVKSYSNRFKRNILVRNQMFQNRVASSKKAVEVFHYELRYKPTFSLAPDYIKTAAHGDDIPLIFGLVYNQPRRDINESDLLITRKVMSYIGNFVHGNNPLLNQHQTIEPATVNETTTSMDETDTNVEPSNQMTSGYIKRNWSSDSQVYPIDMNDMERDEISRLHAHGKQSDMTTELSKHQPSKGQLRLFVISRPQWYNSFGQEIQPLAGYTSGQQQYTDEPVVVDKSQQRLSNVQRYQHLQQQQHLLAENGPWYPITRRNNIIQQAQPAQQQQQQQQQNMMNMIHESSFTTMLLFSSCIFIFATMTFSLALCAMIIRHSMASGHDKNRKHFASSSSSCNICDDSQGGSIDAVLAGGHKKENRGFCNVFAKLRSPDALAQTTRAQLQCGSASTGQRQANPAAASDLSLHPRPTQEGANGSSHP